MIKSHIVSIINTYPVIALAVSGGVDSMAMLEWFRQNRPKDSFLIINIDHHIRGEESRRDSDFVKCYADKYGIELKKYDVDAIGFAKENGYTIEQAARILRHKIFEAAVQQYASAVATAHHAQDQAESVFMHIARGTGIDGLQGMSVEDGHILRPLLFTTKQEILEYVDKNKIEFCEDSINKDNNYSRNFIRNQILPSIKKVYPAIDKNLIKLAERAKEIADFIDQNTPALCLENDGVYCDLKGRHIVIQAEMIRRGFSLLGVVADIEERHIKSIIDFAVCGKMGSLDMPYNTTVYKEKDGVVITKKNDYPIVKYRFSEGFFEISGFELVVQKVNDFCKNNLNDSAGINKTLYIAVDDFDLDSLVIRQRQNGDRIAKFGGGSKSLGDFLTDKKVPLRFRDRLPVIANGNDILCVCGVEIAEKAKLLDTSKKIYKINLISN